MFDATGGENGDGRFSMIRKERATRGDGASTRRRVISWRLNGEPDAGVDAVVRSKGIGWCRRRGADVPTEIEIETCSGCYGMINAACILRWYLKARRSASVGRKGVSLRGLSGAVEGRPPTRRGDEFACRLMASCRIDAMPRDFSSYKLAFVTSSSERACLQ